MSMSYDIETYGKVLSWVWRFRAYITIRELKSSEWHVLAGI